MKEYSNYIINEINSMSDEEFEMILNESCIQKTKVEKKEKVFCMNCSWCIGYGFRCSRLLTNFDNDCKDFKNVSDTESDQIVSTGETK